MLLLLKGLDYRSSKSRSLAIARYVSCTRSGRLGFVRAQSWSNWR
jgi:hypothetical protein